MSKKLLLFLFFISVFKQGNSQAPEWEWAKSACLISVATNVTSITTDPSGNIFIAGNFRDSALFGSTVYHPTGTANMFLAKYDSTGGFLWMRYAKGANAPALHLVTDICSDSVGNCYITGYFNGQAIFDHDTITSIGPLPDVFIAKFTPSGSVAWLQQGTGVSSDYAHGIGLDADGNCYVGGTFQVAVDFGNLHLAANNSSNDIFVLKLDGAGNFISGHTAGGSSGELLNTMAVDKAGNCYVAGTFLSTDFVFNTDTLIYSNTSADAFTAKFDSAGNALWAAAGTGPSNQEPSGISYDQSGNCYVTGIFKGDTMYLDTTTLITFGYWDFFTAIYDVSGNLTWAGNQGSSTFGTEVCLGIVTDTSGNFYTTGQFRTLQHLPRLL